jgi:choice-of-anchor A domain-containing protein
MKNRLFVLVLCAITSLFFSKPVSATNLGIANDYNLFVFENLYGYNSDSEGNLAAGGNAYLGSYSVGSELNGNNARLVVGGNLTWESGGGRVGQDGKGNLYAGGTTNTVPWATYNRPSLPQNVVDFSAAQSYLNQASKAWSTQTTTGTIKSEYGILDLTGTSSKLNVFNLKAQDVDINTLNITAPAGSTVLVNVSGSNVAMEDFGMYLKGGLTSNYVLFNFYDATSLTLKGCGFEGSVLAPNTAINFQNGQLNGTLIGKSFGSAYASCGEVHNRPFQGDLPNVPEPATLLLIASGGVLLMRRKMA